VAQTTVLTILVSKILLRSGNLLDGRSGLGRSDQSAGHGFQVGVQKVWVSLLWTVLYWLHSHGSWSKPVRGRVRASLKWVYIPRAALTP